VSVYDGSQVVWTAEAKSPAALEAPRRIQSMLWRPDIDQLLAIQDGPAGSDAAKLPVWTLTDPQGTVKDYLAKPPTDDAESGLLLTRRYSAFGTPEPAQVWASGPEGNFTDVSGESGFFYVGQEYDAETGLQYSRARYYDPRSREFIGQDPLGFVAGDTNLYRRVGNSPVNATDPSGLADEWAQQAAGRNVPAAGWTGLTVSGGETSKIHEVTPAPATNYPGITAGNIPNRYFSERVKAIADANRDNAMGVIFGTLVGPVALVDGTIFNAIHEEARKSREKIKDQMLSSPDSIQKTMGGIALGLNYAGEGFAMFGAAEGGAAPLYAVKGLAVSGASARGAAPSSAIPSEFKSQLARGGSYIMTEEQYLLYAKGKQVLGRSNGQFMTSASEMNKIVVETGGDSVQMAQRLGLQNITPETVLIRMDVTDPLKFNPRMPTSSMSGANPLFVPGGKTIGGVPEIVTDPLPYQQVWATPIKRK